MPTVAELWETEAPAKTAAKTPAQQQGVDDLRTFVAQAQQRLRDTVPGSPTHQRLSRELSDAQSELSKYGSAPAATAAGNTIADLWETTPEAAAPAPAAKVARVGTRAAAPQPFVAQGEDLTAQQVPGKVADAVQRLLQGTASLADVAIAGGAGMVGQAGYAASRFMGAPEQRAKQIEQQIAGPYQNVLGRAFGITEAPAYKGEATRQIMDFVGQNVEKGADWISQKTGIPKSDVENMINTLTVAAGPKVAKVTGAVGEALAPITQIAAPIEKPKIPYSAMQKAVQQQRFAEMQQAAQPQKGAAPPPGSVGAAGVTKQTQVESLLADASPDLQQKVRSLSIEDVNPDALQTRILEEKHGVTLSQGQRTDKKVYATEWNNRGAHPETLGNLFEQQPAQMLDAIDNVGRKVAPNAGSTSPTDLGQKVMDAFVAKDAARQANINQLYQQLRDANGGSFPIDAPALVTNVERRLKKELLSNDAPSSQFNELKRLAESNAMTFEDYLSLRRNLGDIARTSSDGSTRRAAGLIIEELEKLPLQEGAKQLKPLADQARAAARERFQTIEKVPGYKLAINEALSSQERGSGMVSPSAAKFLDRTLTSKGDIQRMIGELGAESDAHQAIRAFDLEKLKEKAGFKGEKKTFSPRAMSDYLHKQRDKLFEIYGPEGVRELAELDLLGSKIAQPKEHVFNFSNTTSSFIADLAKQGVKTGLESWAAGVTGGVSVPVVAAGKQLFQNAKNKAYGQKAIDPYSGLSIKD